MASRTELIRLLTAYSPTDEREEAYRLEMLDLAASSLDPFDRYHYTPGHFTASGFAVHPQAERVLMIHHAKLNLWLQPGGHVEPDDGPLIDAARREIEEETGVSGLRSIDEAPFDIDIHVFPGQGDQPRHQHYDIRFAFVATDPELGDSDEVLEVRWVDAGEMPALNVDVSVTRPVAKLFGDGIIAAT